MTHCYIRAMSPIHLKCENFLLFCFTLSYISRFEKYGCTRIHVIRECLLHHEIGSIIHSFQSIIVSGQLWGLVSCLAYGDHGMRVSFPVRQMLRLLSQAISRNVERLSYAERLHTKKLVNSLGFGLKSSSKF